MILRNLIIAGVLLALCPASAGDKGKSSYVWHDVTQLRLEGRGWPAERAAFYDRLPPHARESVTAKVWELSHHTAGLFFRFKTGADSIRLRWTLLSGELGLKNMPPTAVSGIDLYAREKDGRWVFAGNGRPRALSNDVRFNLPESEAYMIYLPLYNGIREMSVGIPSGEAFEQPAPDSAARPVVFYGTSITQGGCASRPGMAATAILARDLEVPLVNLGFSGAGKMEPAMAGLLAETDAALYVLDCLWNMDEDMVAHRVEPFIRRLRQARPGVPIVLVEDSNYRNQIPTARGKILRRIHQKLTGSGMEGLYFLSAENMLGTDGEATVDSVHPNDLGMMRQARVFADFLGPLLKAPEMPSDPARRR